MAKKKKPVWFKGRMAADWVTRFTVGDDYLWDTLLLPFDAVATAAHAEGLVDAGVLDLAELREAKAALGRIRREAEAGEVGVTPEDEDCHTVIERYLTAELGEIGEKIHTGRSRNDQVLAALRLFLRDRLITVARTASEIVEMLCGVAEKHDDALMPGYTHMQLAMPTTAGLWAAGYAELLVTDILAVRAAYDQINTSPLGSAAGYGVPHLKLRRKQVAKTLGFKEVQSNVTAVQLSRGKLELHVAHACVQIGATLNRMASDLVLFNTSEFGFVRLPEEYTTGSSIMPQKRNPDVLELARAAYHRLTAEMHVLASVPANLPSGYHRDLQLTKAAVMQSVLTTTDLIEAFQNVLPGIEFDRDRMRQACGPELLATGRAMEMVRDGTPFREAYRAAAKTSGLHEQVTDEVLKTYLVDGYPGRADVDAIRKRRRPLDKWIQEAGGSDTPG
jgi:argininosuccinate lyase